MEHFEKLSAALKNLVQVLAVLLLIGFAARLVRNQADRLAFRQALADFGIQSLKVAGAEISFAACREAVQEAAQPVSPAKSGQDTAPPPKVAEILSQSDETGTFWIYVGTFNRANGQSVDRANFNVTVKPQVNQAIVAATDTYKRASKPIWDDRKRDWVLGKVEGVVKEGERITVKDTAEVEADDNTSVNVWVRAVSPTPSGKSIS
jgi:hypothetical protein